MRKQFGLAALPLALAGAGMGLYALYLRRARAGMRRTPPDSLIQPDLRDFDADLHLDGVVNARDLGGYTTADGRRVRRGMVYRSGDLSAATDHDLERLQALDVQLVLDLRHNDEVDAAPDRLPAGAVYAHLPYNVPAAKLLQIAELMRNLGHLDGLMLRIYDDIALKTGAPKLGILLRHLATDDHALPVLIHCTAGKDRTGFTAAILLAVLGVPDEAIYADYSLSNRAYPLFYEGTARSVQSLARIGLYPDDLHVLLLADPAVLQALFGRLREQYGSLEGYLAACSGVDARTLEQLRARLLEAAYDAD